jgi:hypothetical protein
MVGVSFVGFASSRASRYDDHQSTQWIKSLSMDATMIRGEGEDGIGNYDALG